MRARGAVTALVLATALALAGCEREVPQTATVTSNGSNTSVLGGTGPDPRDPDAPLADARGRAIPPPPVPANTQAQAVRSGEDEALGVWVNDGRVLAASWTRAGGWTAAQPLEDIHGEATDVQLVSNGNGVAMAVWRHTVGSIRSLRFSRYERGAGWSRPDVMPGALPRPDASAGPGDGPRLQMDAQGNVTAQWPSGFREDEIQTARYVDGQGWTDAASEPVASAPSASPAPPAPSSAR